MNKTLSDNIWWGEYSLAEDTFGFWQIGGLQLWVTRSRVEYVLTILRGNDAFEATLIGEIPSERAVPDTSCSEAHRFGFQRTDSQVFLRPLLADRPVVFNPSTPFSLLPKEEATLYISAAVWLQIQVGDTLDTLIEIPTFRQSDTWFGRSTIRGELCYASRTHARVEAESVPVTPHRATTTVRVRNQADTNLAIEKIKLPLPNMSIFTTPEGQLWTETVTLTRREDGDMAAIDLGKSPPSHIKGVRLLTGPREEPAKGLFSRVFSGFTGTKGLGHD